MTKRQVIVCDDLAALSERAARQFVALVAHSIKQRARVNIALSGGSTPRALYSLLATASFSANVDWSRVHLFWGDERCVAPDLPDSNFRMTQESLLDRIAIPRTNVHRMRGEAEAEAAARAYETVLRQQFGAVEWPRFDLVLLGLGEDGHTASLFPGTTALTETRRWVAANFVEQLATHRLTLTFPVLNSAAQVSFLVTGASKATVLKQILQSDNAKLPAARIQPADGSVTWFLDRAAAQQLT